MLKEQEPSFIKQILLDPPTQFTEEFASLSHETRRLPDPYIFIVSGEKLLTPSGDLIEDCVEKRSYLGNLEFTALQKIQQWTGRNNEGIVVWFSPPFDNYYPAAKVIISEISLAENGTKVLFNRALVLDFDEPSLLKLANQLTGIKQFNEAETLRAFPIFPKSYEFRNWLEQLSLVTNQMQLVMSGEDLQSKAETYAGIDAIDQSFSLAGKNTYYAQIYEAVQQEGLIGDNQGSCQALDITSFEVFFKSSLLLDEVKTLICICPFCKQRVTAVIENGSIHCPNCNQSNDYTC